MYNATITVEDPNRQEFISVDMNDVKMVCTYKDSQHDNIFTCEIMYKNATNSTKLRGDLGKAFLSIHRTYL